jgi:acetolactate synthase I/II/III large subunit
MLDEVKAGVAHFVASDGQMVLDVRVSRSVISVPYSWLWFGEDV